MIHRVLAMGRRRHRTGIRLSRGSVLFIAAVLLIGGVAIDSDANLLVLVFGFCVAAILLSLATGWRVVRSLQVVRLLPGVCAAGQPLEVRYQVSNPRRFGCARDLVISDPLPPGSPASRIQGFVPLLRPGETITLSVPVSFPKRGRVQLTSLRLATSFPFGLFTKQVRVPSPGELVVFPALGRLLFDVTAASRRSDPTAGGSAPSRVAGDEEYYGVREYRVGDNPRRIHWRSTARTGQLMIREMTRIRDRQLWCVVDTRVPPHDPELAERLELAMSCAATVICDALERGAKVGLICNGEPLLVIPPAGGRPHRPRLLRELALRGENTSDLLTPHIRRQTWPAGWRGPCLLFAAGSTDDLWSAAQMLGRTVGPVSIYTPQTAVFNGFFVPPNTMAAKAVAAADRAGRKTRRSVTEAASAAVQAN